MTTGPASELRAPAIGGAACVLAYLVTCAAYKSYILVPMVGVTVGAIFELLVRARRDDARRLDSRARDEG